MGDCLQNLFVLQISLRQTSRATISMQAIDELKLFVGGLPWAMESEDLKQVFNTYVKASIHFF